MKWEINEPVDLKRIAEEFIEKYGNRSIFLLYGKMGVGKTTFVKYLAEVLGIEEDVNSPTFAIINEYITNKGESVFHFDCYRIKSVEEALDFGCEEYFSSGAMCFIEWPELIEPLIPEDALKCYFSEKENGKRILEIV